MTPDEAPAAAPQPPLSGWMWLGFEPLPEGSLRSAYVTVACLALVCVVFGVTAVLGDTTDTDHLTRFGALDRSLFWSGEYWRLLTAAVLHFGFAHFFFNAVTLPGWSARVERDLGRAAVAFVIVGSALAGSAVSAINFIGVGAGISGAICGLMGTVLVLEWRAQDQSFSRFLARPGVGRRLFVVVSLLWVGWSKVGAKLEIDGWGHAGGLVFGLLAGVFLTTKARARYAVPALVLAALVAVACVPSLTRRGRWQVAVDDAYARSDAPAMLEALRWVPPEVKREYVYLQRGWALVNVGRYDDAVRELDVLLAPVPRAKFLRWKESSVFEVDALRLRGFAKHRLGKSQDALIDLSAAVELKPEDTAVRYARAEVFRSLGRAADARADLDASLAVARAADALALRAWTRMDLNDDEGASSDVEEAAELSFERAQLESLRGWLAHRKSEYQTARGHFEQALVLDPAAHAAAEGLCLTAADGEEEPDAIVDACYLATEQVPGSARLHVKRAIALTALDRFDEAAADYEAALELEPDNMSARVGHAWVLVMDERADEGRDEARAILRENPDELGALAVDAEDAVGRKDWKTALARYRHALELAHDDWNFHQRATEVVQALGPRYARRAKLARR